MLNHSISVTMLTVVVALRALRYSSHILPIRVVARVLDRRPWLVLKDPGSAVKSVDDSLLYFLRCLFKVEIGR